MQIEDRLIRASDAKRAIDHIDPAFSYIIDNVPTVETVHGRNLKEDWPSLFECSVCNWSDYDTYTGDTSTYNYCPNCGARMDGLHDE